MTGSPHSLARPHNNLLSRLSASDFGLLQPHLERIVLPVRHVTEPVDRPVPHVYFPESGIISLVAVAPHDKQIEVALIGWEGMSGINVVLGDDRSVHSGYMQVAGHGVRIPTVKLTQALRKSLSLQSFLLRFAQALMTQTAQTALANGRAKLENRLAR
jgi:hypothetical protein